MKLLDKSKTGFYDLDSFEREALFNLFVPRKLPRLVLPKVVRTHYERYSVNRVSGDRSYVVNDKCPLALPMVHARVVNGEWQFILGDADKKKGVSAQTVDAKLITMLLTGGK